MNIVNNNLEENSLVYKWELEKIQDWPTNMIKNYIWMAVDCGQPIPGNVSVEALRMELKRRGEEPKGYHNA